MPGSEDTKQNITNEAGGTSLDWTEEQASDVPTAILLIEKQKQFQKFLESQKNWAGKPGIIAQPLVQGQGPMPRAIVASLVEYNFVDDSQQQLWVRLPNGVVRLFEHDQYGRWNDITPGKASWQPDPNEERTI